MEACRCNLCHLKDIQLLDFSLNYISGTMPQCLNNLTTMDQKGNSSQSITHRRSIYVATTFSLIDYEDDASLIWKGRMSVYKSTLGLVKSIDFSRYLVFLSWTCRIITYRVKSQLVLSSKALIPLFMQEILNFVDFHYKKLVLQGKKCQNKFLKKMKMSL